MLTQEYLHELFYYRHGKLFWAVAKANRTNVGDVAGWPRKDGYWEVCIDGRSYNYHRVIYLYHHGELPKYVDHIDRNPSNNRIENLREISAADNRVNSSETWTEAGLRGVKIARNGRFEARIMKDGKTCQIGTFATAEEAHQAYLSKRAELYPGIYT